MTDQEVQDLLGELGAKHYARYARRDPGFETLPPGLPAGTEGDICSLLWHVGMKPMRDALLSAGATSDQIEMAYARQKYLLRITEHSDLAMIPSDLAESFASDLGQALKDAPPGPQRLDEKWIKEISDNRVEIYHNEGQHRGRPHVAVILQDGKVSISLDDPPTILTPKGIRGEASAVKTVAKHRLRLLDVWNSTRPDDQKLPIVGRGSNAPK